MDIVTIRDLRILVVLKLILLFVLLVAHANVDLGYLQLGVLLLIIIFIILMLVVQIQLLGFIPVELVRFCYLMLIAGDEGVLGCHIGPFTFAPVPFLVILLASIVETTLRLLNDLLHELERRTFLGLRNYALYQSPYLPARNHARSDNCRVHLEQVVDDRVSGRDLFETFGRDERQERYFVHELLAGAARHVVLEAELRRLKLDTEVDGHDL